MNLGTQEVSTNPCEGFSLHSLTGCSRLGLHVGDTITQSENSAADNLHLFVLTVLLPALCDDVLHPSVGGQGNSKRFAKENA